MRSLLFCRYLVGRMAAIKMQTAIICRVTSRMSATTLINRSSWRGAVKKIQRRRCRGR